MRLAPADATLLALRGDVDPAVTALAAATVRAAARPFRLEHARTVLALAEAHVLALAHVVRRPILVFADDLGGPPGLRTRSFFRGAYLPALLPRRLRPPPAAPPPTPVRPALRCRMS